MIVDLNDSTTIDIKNIEIKNDRLEITVLDKSPEELLHILSDNDKLMKIFNSGLVSMEMRKYTKYVGTEFNESLNVAILVEDIEDDDMPKSIKALLSL